MSFFSGCTCYLWCAVLCLAPAAASAMPAITCHCFIDRSFDAAHPAAADPYFLATTQNSFFAVAFGVDKKTIVMDKQQGMSADDLWIAYWLAARSGEDPDALLQWRKTRGSWRQIAAQPAIRATSMGARFADALKNDASDKRLAETVVDELLTRFRFYGEPELTELRKAGAGNQELILAGLLAAKTRQPATKLYRSAKKGWQTWGALLTRARIDATDIQTEVAALIRNPPR